jgi:hypothetical protein
VDLRRQRGVALLGVSVVTGALGGACSSDIFDVKVDLKAQTYRADFGAQAGDVPTVACDPGVPQACGTGTTVAVDLMAEGGTGEVAVALGCDDATTRCFAQAEARLAMDINVLQDEDFVTKVERRAIGLVRVVDVAYTVPANTLTFEVPRVDIYAGPEGSRRETDPGVAIVGSTAPIPSAATFSAEQHVAITDDTPAQPVIEDAIRNQRTFVFIVVLAPRLESGSPVPGGAIELNVSPSLLIGFPR